jgi:ParB family transcriptional regulator, chromosome partitioning protein
LSLKDLKSKSDAALADIPQPVASGQGSRRPITAPGATAFMQPTLDALSERAIAAEAKALEYEKRLQDQPSELLLEVLEEVPTRRRTLNAEQFAELKENLRSNPLVHPISVEPLAAGRYRIISGHNRVDAYRELGKMSILAVVRDIETERVDRSAFYANLLQPSLPDYEKYLGFKRERELTGKTQKELAAEAGVAESVLSMLFSFEALPSEALVAIARRPDAIGMSCAVDLAKAARAGKQAQARVLEAVERLVEGVFSQKEAVKYVGAVPLAPRTQQVVSPTKVKAGRHEFCQYVSRGATIRIDFRRESHRVEAESEISELLKRLATALAGDSKF